MRVEVYISLITKKGKNENITSSCATLDFINTPLSMSYIIFYFKKIQFWGKPEIYIVN